MKLVLLADRQLTIAELNARFPVGTPCIYHSVRRDGRLEEPGRSTRTRSVFWELGHGRQVVSVKGVSGGVAVDHIRFLEGERPIEQN